MAMSLWQIPLIRRATFAVSRRSRMRKLDQFYNICAPRPEDIILDIGVAPGNGWSARFESHPVENFLENSYKYPEKIVGVSIDDLSGFVRVHPKTQAIRADACSLPFRDGSFDIVFTNAVIEHVGDDVNQEKFVRECLRVARRQVFLTAPNRMFPYDVHIAIPLLHWFPRSTYARFTQDRFLHLLFPWELMRLLPKGAAVKRVSPIWAPSTVVVVQKVPMGRQV